MGLCAIIEDRLKMDPTSGTPFQFCGRRRDRIKALFREPDGFVLIYKRLSVQGDTNGPGSSQKSGIFPGESLTG
nr:IS66 family insertion sequence element accessory protein TnpB [uncultured Blautia sp.]